jgi:hypothetical protein
MEHMSRPLYQALAVRVGAYRNCRESGKVEWADLHKEAADELCKAHLPSGAGLDLGPCLDWALSTGEHLVFKQCDFHHMDENGGYYGWTEHKVNVRPSLQFGFQVSVSGRNHNDIKDYIADCFHDAMLTPVEG